MKPGKFWAIVIVLTVVVASLIWLLTPPGPPQVPFEGLTQEALLVDEYTRSPNGDGSDLQAYQLAKFDAAAWTDEQKRKGTKWVRGPLTDKKHLKALDWFKSFCFAGRLPSDFEIKRWIGSKQVYFHLESYDEYESDTTPAEMHYASMWVLDAEKSRLYYLSYCL